MPASAWQELPARILFAGPSPGEDFPSFVSHLGTVIANTHQGWAPNQTARRQSNRVVGIAASYQVALIGFSEFLSLGTIIPVCRLFLFSRELETQVFALKSLEFKCWQPVEVLVDHFEGQHANLTTFVGRAGPGGLRVTCF